MALYSTDPESALQSLKNRAQVFVAHFDPIYKTPEHGRLIHGYIREHVFVSLERSTLPIENDNTTIELFNIAYELTLTFFSQGKAAAIGWPASMTDDVLDDLEQVIRYTLLVPVTRGTWRDDWTLRLRQMAARLPRLEEEVSASQAEGTVTAETGAVGEGKGKGKEPEPRQATDLTQIAQQANALVESTKDGEIKKGAISLGGLPSANSPRPIGTQGLALQPEQDEAASHQQEGITTGSVIGMRSRGGMVDIDWDADNEDDLDEDGGFLNPFTGEREGPGGKAIEVSSKNTYDCAMCGKVFGDADALNEHYQLHFAD